MPFDYTIIGTGAAGLHLALAMEKDSFFENKKILLIDKVKKDKNDRTWCFWEQGTGLWDNILTQSWQHGEFYSKSKHVELALLPYHYKMLRGIDFYSYAFGILSGSPRFTIIINDVKDLETGDLYKIKGVENDYLSEYVFDSRIPDDFYKNAKNYTNILQHFKGWMIRTKEDFFDPDNFVMMDYRMQFKESTSFSYVLPLNKREAMVEFTLFTTDLICDEDYDVMLRRYIKEVLHLDDFEITEVEKGIIPMSDFPFERYSKNKHILIGTAGGWVKPSSGYSFKNCEKNAMKLIGNIKLNRDPNFGIISKRFRWFDSLFLNVLAQKNHLGPKLFEIMYFKNNVKQILKFLDEETSISEDLKITATFPKFLFTKAILNVFLRRFKNSEPKK